MSQSFRIRNKIPKLDKSEHNLKIDLPKSDIKIFIWTKDN